MVFRKQFLLLFICVFVFEGNAQFQKDSVFVKFNLKWKNEPLELNKANDNGRLMSMSSLLASTSGIILALLTFLKK
jgi:hypothetical protein